MKFPINLLFLVLLSASFSVNLFAQCETVHFKTANRKIYQPNMSFYAENSSFPKLHKDMTGDGKADLVSSGFNTNQIYIAPNLGNGNFGSLISLSLSQSVAERGDVYIHDFTNDGLNDVLVQYYTAPPVYKVFRNNGNSTFTQLATTTGNGFENVKGFADVNNDSRADILLGTAYRLGNADGSFSAPVQITSSSYLEFAADFSGDGLQDFPFVFGNYTLRIAYNQGNGNFTVGGDMATVGTNGVILGFWDFNNDGRRDILARNDSEMVVIRGLEGGGFNSVSYPSNSGLSYHIGDFNGDGFQDVLAKAPAIYSPSVLNQTTSAALFTNNGAGGFTRTNIEVPRLGFPFGDQDGDNKVDFLLFNNSVVNFTESGGMLFSETQIHFQKNICRKPGQTTKVDFDGDNVTDKAFFRPTDGRWRYKKSSDSSIVNLNWGLSSDIPVPGDYDRDGKTDVAIYRPSDGTWWIVNSSNGGYSTTRFGISEDKPVPADFDGDGTTDIAVFRPSDGNWYIYFTGTGQVSIQHFGIAEDKPVPTDYDGDGKTDLAVFRPSTGIWYYLKSSDGNFAALRWGIQTDLPAPADYDGDAKAELAVYRRSERKWYILRSFNSQFTAYGFGATDDALQPGDFDGNGVFDLGVFRTSSGLWYSTVSNNPETFGETGEIPVSSILRTE